MKERRASERAREREREKRVTINVFDRINFTASDSIMKGKRWKLWRWIKKMKNKITASIQQFHRAQAMNKIRKYYFTFYAHPSVCLSVSVWLAVVAATANEQVAKIVSFFSSVFFNWTRGFLFFFSSFVLAVWCCRCDKWNEHIKHTDISWMREKNCWCCALNESKLVVQRWSNWFLKPDRAESDFDRGTESNFVKQIERGESRQMNYNKKKLPSHTRPMYTFMFLFICLQFKWIFFAYDCGISPR